MNAIFAVTGEVAVTKRVDETQHHVMIEEEVESSFVKRLCGMTAQIKGSMIRLLITMTCDSTETETLRAVRATSRLQMSQLKTTAVVPAETVTVWSLVACMTVQSLVSQLLLLLLLLTVILWSRSACLTITAYWRRNDMMVRDQIRTSHREQKLPIADGKIHSCLEGKRLH